MHQIKSKMTLVLLILSFTFFSACSNQSADRSMKNHSLGSVGDRQMATAGKTVASKPNATQDAMRQGLVSDSQFKMYDHKIIKTTSLSIAVDDYRKSMYEIQSLVELHGAYIARENHNFQRNEIQGNTIEIRVPTEEFNDLLNGIEKVSNKILSKELKAEDIGQEFVDIEARIRSKKAVMKRYEEILQRSGTVEELLEVEEKLRHLREEIEAKEGRLRYLQNRVSYGTIVLNVRQHREIAPVLIDNKYTFDDDLKDAFFFGWTGIKSLLLILAHLWPFWFLGLPLAYFVHRVFFRRKTEQNLVETFKK